jgi:hypothetical protein
MVLRTILYGFRGSKLNSQTIGLKFKIKNVENSYYQPFCSHILYRKTHIQSEIKRVIYIKPKPWCFSSHVRNHCRNWKVSGTFVYLMERFAIDDEAGDTLGVVGDDVGRALLLPDASKNKFFLLDSA